MSNPQKKLSVKEIAVRVSVGVLFFGSIAAVILPFFVKSRYISCCNACVNNLRQIDAAACQFALENHRTNGSPINFPDDLTPYIKLNSAGKIPGCPEGGIYSIQRVGDKPSCSIGTNVTPWHVLP